MARVSSADEDSNRANLIDSPWQTVEQIRCKSRFFSQAFRCKFTATAMEPNGSKHCALPVIRVLRDTACNHARQNVAGSASCHGRRTGGIDPGVAIRKSNHRAISLEYDGRSSRFGKVLGCAEAIGLYLLGR